MRDDAECHFSTSWSQMLLLVQNWFGLESFKNQFVFSTNNHDNATSLHLFQCHDHLFFPRVPGSTQDTSSFSVPRMTKLDLCGTPYQGSMTQENELQRTGERCLVFLQLELVYLMTYTAIDPVLILFSLKSNTFKFQSAFIKVVLNKSCCL